jgi:hypothetical protein
LKYDGEMRSDNKWNSQVFDPSRPVNNGGANAPTPARVMCESGESKSFSFCRKLN